MQRREKILAIILLAVVAGYQIVPSLWNAWNGPLEERRTQLALVQSSLDEKLDKQLAISRANARIRDAKARSLPPDPFTAQRVYQQWLTDLAMMTQFGKLAIVPSRRTDKRDVYSAVQVTVSGEATLDQVCRFLYLFHRTDLAHRIVKLDLESLANQGNPLLEVNLTAEGLAIVDAPPRRNLFPRAVLGEAVEAEATRVVVTSPDDGFPEKTPFRIRINQEFLEVTNVEGTQWTVKRGLDFSSAADHAAESVVELTPIRSDGFVMKPEDYRIVLENNPFAKPGPPYEPKIAPIDEVIAHRGASLKFTPTVTTATPAPASARFRLVGDAPEGLKLDPATGTMEWSPTAEEPLAEYELALEILNGPSDKPLISEEFRLAVREPNRPPVIEPVAGTTAVLGRELALTIKARDEVESSRLTYSLAEGAPEGATIDASTGELRWTPPATMSPGQVEVTVQVADDGQPPQTASQKFAIQVAHDVAKFTKLVGCVRKGEDVQAYLRDQLNNKLFVLSQGNEFRYGDIQVSVLSIGADFVVFNMKNESWRLELGENLRSMKKVPAAGSTELSAAQ